MNLIEKKKAFFAWLLMQPASPFDIKPRMKFDSEGMNIDSTGCWLYLPDLDNMEEVLDAILSEFISFASKSTAELEVSLTQAEQKADEEFRAQAGRVDELNRDDSKKRTNDFANGGMREDHDNN